MSRLSPRRLILLKLCLPVLATAAIIGGARAEELITFASINGSVHRVVYHGSRAGNFHNNLAVSIGADGVSMVDHRNTIALPDVTFMSALTVHFNGEQIHFIHLRFSPAKCEFEKNA